MLIKSNFVIITYLVPLLPTKAVKLMKSTGLTRQLVTAVLLISIKHHSSMAYSAICLLRRSRNWEHRILRMLLACKDRYSPL